MTGLIASAVRYWKARRRYQRHVRKHGDLTPNGEPMRVEDPPVDLNPNKRPNPSADSYGG